jgi:L-fuconolactonase
VIVDAHQHFWRLGEHDCVWPTPDLAPIYRNFEPAEFELLAEREGVAGSVLVQSQESDRDTDWLLELAARSDVVKAVVGWTDLLAPDAPKRIAALAARPKLRGLRPLLQSLHDGWIADPRLDPAIAAMKEHGLSFDALVFTRHLADLRSFALRHPDLPIVIDHGAKPPIVSGLLDHWRSEIEHVAELPNVFCKLSGLLTEALPDCDGGLIRSCVGHLVETFGAARLMWGSDWPVLNLAGDYPDWLAMARSLTSEGVSHAIFAGTARMFYRI